MLALFSKLTSNSPLFWGGLSFIDWTNSANSFDGGTVKVFLLFVTSDKVKFKRIYSIPFSGLSDPELALLKKLSSSLLKEYIFFNYFGSLKFSNFPESSLAENSSSKKLLVNFY